MPYDNDYYYIDLYAAVIDLYCYWPAKIEIDIPVSQICAFIFLPSDNFIIFEWN